MMFWYLSLINKQQIEYGGEINPNAEKEVIKVKSKVGKSNGGRKRRKGERKGAFSETRRRGGSNAEIAYKAPQYDMSQVSQYLTPIPQGKQSYLLEHDEELEAYSDSEDSSEEEIHSRRYYHHGDGYVSDGTDGGYLDDNQDFFNGDNMATFNYNGSTDDFDGESNSITPTRSPPQNGKSSLLSFKNRLTASSNARHSANNRAKSPVKPRPVSPGPRHGHPKSSTSKKNLKVINSSGGEDEDDDVPLGLYRSTLIK
ncbi:12234_t:CDS:1 [Acaulospora colombiana]|uniref:12234_t:CDS:1 n=1 Tax=Acaulospora colombiana TaxID=27376 RepID=A0ACA9JYD4_9GLOM|nr:12234_t:CDS:1 [Acaulospora colombiana]